MNSLKINHCKKIDVASLLNKKSREKLTFFQKDGNFEDNDIIWQQMSCTNFSKLLRNNALCFRQLSTYSDNDERKLRFYEECYLNDINDDKKKKLIQERNSNFEQIAYISCWFRLNYLTEQAFDKYAKKDGVAIGVKIKDLVEAIEKNSNNMAPYEEIYYGKTAYLEQSQRLVTNEEEAIAPLFLKDNSKLSDSEFRLVYIRDSIWINAVEGMELPKTFGANNDSNLYFINIGDAQTFIKYIAIKEYNENFDNAIKANDLSIKIKEGYMDRFITYEVK